MALQDEIRDPILAVLVGAARRGAGGVGAWARSRGRTPGGTPQEQSSSVGRQAGGLGTASQGGGGCQFWGQKDDREGMTPFRPGPCCTPLRA